MRVSRRLEGITLIDRKPLFLPPEAKMAPIQSLGYTRVLGRNHSGGQEACAHSTHHPSWRAREAFICISGHAPPALPDPNRLTIHRRAGTQDACAPTACRLAAASAGNACQNSTDLVREAVGYSGGLGCPSRRDTAFLSRTIPIFCSHRVLGVRLRR